MSVRKEQPNFNSSGTDNADLKPSTKNQNPSSSRTNARNSTPKRKAPPPPQRLKKLSEHKQEGAFGQAAVKPVRQDSVVRRKTAPKKPPRTLSTFLPESDDIPLAKETHCYVCGHLAGLLADTVRSVYAKFLEHAVRPDPLWELGWEHFSVLSSTTILYKGLQMSIQVCVENCSISSSMYIMLCRKCQ